MANAFTQMKDLYKMQREAKKMQNEMRKIKVSGESKRGSVRMYFNGAQEIENITIDEELLDPERQDELVEAVKQAYKDYQKKLQKQMMKNFDMNQLRGMLGS
ncbi:YbaB/EbfC family nucleoid-associated protein [Candidatus Dojkabacteria bacterium]|nr:YbaB/EbfC family nucleoid-associated protein [Candidatus Dojkabacteria bacterium]